MMIMRECGGTSGCSACEDGGSEFELVCVCIRVRVRARQGGGNEAPPPLSVHADKDEA